MKKFYILSIALAMGVIVGCATNIIHSPKTQFELAFGVRFLPEYGQYDNRVRFALKPLKGYGQDEKNSDMRWGDSYYFSEKNLPQTLNIQYAILLDEPVPVNKNIWEATNKKLQSLPPSAWRTHTIYPKQLLDKGTSMPIWDTRYDKVADDQKAKSRVTVTLYIDGNGKVSQNIERTLVLSDSVW